MYFLAAFLQLTVFLWTASQAVPTAHWNTFESLAYDWDGNGKADQFVIEARPAGQLAIHSRLRIRLAGRKEFVLDYPGRWAVFVDDPVLAQWKSRNLVSSDFFLFLPAGPHHKPYLFLFGDPVASSPGSLHVLVLRDGSPALVLFREELELADLQDLDRDGTPEIIGRPCLSQTWGPGLLTYDPLHVYRLSAKTGRAMLSLGLSRSYNLKHYYGWIGPECREDYAVVLKPPDGGRPRILKRDDAFRLFEKSPPR